MPKYTKILEQDNSSSALLPDDERTSSLDSGGGGSRVRNGSGYASIPVDEGGDEEGGEERGVPVFDETVPTGTVTSSWINITNTILGSGMLAMPSALAGVGLGLGIVLIGLSGAASAFGLILLTKVAAEVGRTSSFFACSKITYPGAAVLFDLAIAVKCFGVSVSYLVICGDLLPKVVAGFVPGIEADSIWLTRELWISICMALILPLCFLRRLDSLRYTSAFALLAVVYLLFIVVSYYIFPPPDMPPRPAPSEIRWVNVDSKFLNYLPIFVFAFTCHQNIFSVYNELIDNAPSQVGRVIYQSVGTAFGAYQTIGIIGYLTFGDQVPSNILQKCTVQEYPDTIPFYPLQCHPCRASLDKVISCGGSQSPMPTKKWILITCGIIVTSYGTAILVLSLVGATGSTTICYILPGLFYYKLCKQKVAQSGEPERFDFTRFMALVLATFGTLIMITSLVSQVAHVSSDVVGGHMVPRWIDHY
ncbi:hypothetical protein HK104_011323 [Borealophlyctis nickersoniae]|nr:hypothetical protein HK104_011323 [Borealophlyctis nickersoniae]